MRELTQASQEEAQTFPDGSTDPSFIVNSIVDLSSNMWPGKFPGTPLTLPNLWSAPIYY